ncbi:flotillin, partial [Microbacterium sp. SUBG005]
MEFAALGAIGIVVVIALVVVIVVILIIAGLIRGWYRVAKADEALVIVGKRQKSADGESSRITVITGGGAIVNPLTQRGEMISLRARQIKMEPTAQSSNGVTVNVSGVAL